jgi:hypothetical protein
LDDVKPLGVECVEKDGIAKLPILRVPTGHFPVNDGQLKFARAIDIGSRSVYDEVPGLQIGVSEHDPVRKHVGENRTKGSNCGGWAGFCHTSQYSFIHVGLGCEWTVHFRIMSFARVENAIGAFLTTNRADEAWVWHESHAVGSGFQLRLHIFLL